MRINRLTLLRTAAIAVSLCFLQACLETVSTPPAPEHSATVSLGSGSGNEPGSGEDAGAHVPGTAAHDTGHGLTQDPTPPQGDVGGPFGLSQLSSADGEHTYIGDFALAEDCADCHPRQYEELQGSMHSASHHEPFYRAFALLALEEAGEEVYTFCSGCHAPAGVASGLVIAEEGKELPAAATAGVNCDACHQVSKLSGKQGAWGEPGNASLVLDPGDVKFGPLHEVEDPLLHEAEFREYYKSAEFCGSCHNVIHPSSGVRLEHTYAEWEASIYAKKGIVCQDCHMRSVEDAIKVARELKPVVEMGPAAEGGPDRPIYRHYFVGANVNAGFLAHGPKHADMAEARLKSAARLEIQNAARTNDGRRISYEMVVANVAAGHSLPTSFTELREMWVEQTVTSASGRLLYQSGMLDEEGNIEEGSMVFGSHGGDAQGRLTYKAWEVESFIWQRLVPARGEARDIVSVDLPEDISEPVTVKARLLYRSAPPVAIKMVMKDQAFEAKIVEMAVAETVID